MPKTLFILNDPPYGTERSYNALRLANSLSKRDSEEVKVFLIGDAAACAKKDHHAPELARGAHQLGVGPIARWCFREGPESCGDIVGQAEHARFDGHGECFIEIGGGKAGFGGGDFYAEPKPAVTLRQPSWRWHLGKVWVEKSWLYTKL